MNKLLFAASSLFLLSAWLLAHVLHTAPAPSAAAAERAAGGLADGSEVVKAAAALLDRLTPEQRGKATFTFADAERFNWHFIPRPRKGLPMKELGAEERAALEGLIRASLSRTGAATVQEVRGLESILRELEGPNRRFERDPDLYYLSIFGKPGEGRWAWRLEGHHLSLNFALDGTQLIATTPMMFGANPAIVRSGPKEGLRVLAGVEDVARKLVTALDEAQRRAAIGEGRPAEVEGTESRLYKGPLPAGLTADRLDPEQKKLFLSLIGEYTKHLKDDVARAVSGAIESGGLDKLHFAWRGSFKPFEGHSYMVHGPGFIISYINEQNGAAHIHSALRFTEGEFGGE
jgi:hypothetical protein